MEKQLNGVPRPRTWHGPAELMATLCALALAGAACASSAAPPAPAAPPATPAASIGPVASPAPRTTVRVGGVPTFAFAPFLIGQERGYFAEEGLALEIVNIASGAESVPQLAAG